MRLYLLPLALLLSSPAFAQEVNADRFEQLEQDVLLLKRQQDRLRASGSHGEAPPAGNDGGDVGSAQTNVRISALEDEIKQLRGQIEQRDFENRRLSEEMEKFKRDSEFRLGEIEKAMQAPAATPAPAPADTPAEKAQKPAAEKPADKVAKKKMELSVKDTAEKPEEEKTSSAEDSPPTGDTPRDHYNYAFRLLNQNQYDEAAKSFASFVKKFPKDPLVGNAYYWQGETFYIRKDFAKAVNNFRQGYEANPTGPKAGDNLLKLGMSLGALKKNEEACVVLSQVISKFKTASASVAGKATAEHKRLGCE